METAHTHHGHSTALRAVSRNHAALLDQLDTYKDSNGPGEARYADHLPWCCTTGGTVLPPTAAGPQACFDTRGIAPICSIHCCDLNITALVIEASGCSAPRIDAVHA
jgi:hypothetical protein